MAAATINVVSEIEAGLGSGAERTSKLLEALNEDRNDEVPANQLRRGQYWLGTMLFNQWALMQARGGLLPTLNESGMASLVGGLFRRYRSFGAWWEGSPFLAFPLSLAALIAGYAIAKFSSYGPPEG